MKKSGLALSARAYQSAITAYQKIQNPSAKCEQDGIAYQMMFNQKTLRAARELAEEGSEEPQY